MQDYTNDFKFASFPHGKNATIIAFVVLSLAGFILALVQGSNLGMCLGLAVCVVSSLTTSKPMTQVALALAAVASLAIAGYQVVEIRSLYSTAHSPLMMNMCPLAGSMKADDYDIYNRMYSSYTKYCGRGYQLAMLGNSVSLSIWIACGVLAFLVPPIEKEAMIGTKDLESDDPVTDYQNQSDGANQQGGGAMA